jgi:hypothetical protein|tara:strand:+ start:720 stop:956 length:237 start_codon:yes stop_codon:yes gene_type:complete
MKKERIKQIEREQLVSIDNVIFEPMPKKRPSPRDKYIYEYTNAEFEKDFIQLDRMIRGVSLSVIFLTVAGIMFSIYLM